MKIVNCNDERKKELISVSYNYAFNSLLKFLKNIDIDCEVYDHIFNGKEDYEFTVTIDDLDDKTAQYDSLNHCVILDEYTLDDYLYMIDEKIKSEDLIIKNLAQILLHEMIHSLRTINVNYQIDNSDREKYDQMLYSVLDKYDISKFETYIPVNIKKDNDVIKIVAYNEDTKRYDKFKINNSVLDNTAIEDYIIEISKLLNNQDNSKDKNKKIEASYDIRSAVASDYYDILNGKVNFNSIPSSRKSYGLEESLTEVISTLIISLASKDDFNINRTLLLLYDRMEHPDEKVASYLLMRLDKDYIKWFITPLHENSKDIFTDKFEHFFGTDYEEILRYFNEMYFKEKMENIKISKDIIDNKKK